MRRYGEEIKYFSEELKIQIVREIESGKYSQIEACRNYGIKRGTVFGWLKVYGKLWGKRKVVEVVMSDQKDKIEELQKALAEAHLKLRIYDKMIDIADKHYKTDIKKNFGTKVSEPLEEKEPKSK